jgi:hypothetical protein
MRLVGLDHNSSLLNIQPFSEGASEFVLWKVNSLLICIPYTPRLAKELAEKFYVS